MNTFLNELKNETNLTLTENGAITHKTTKSDILDMFALCGAFRNRSEADCITMFKNALAEDESLAIKCLFYLADCRGGQGERRFFRVCFKWLANNYPAIAARNIEAIPEYRRWDDVLYSCIGTPVEKDALVFIKKQLALDVTCKTPSLLAKWLPSENASSIKTKKMGAIVRKYLGFTHKQYRLMLSALRTRINIVEKLMSENRWDEIEFDKIPSRAGLIYKNAFARRDIIAKKYEAFAKDKNAKVNAATLYPYEIVEKAIRNTSTSLDNVDRLAIEKYWQSLPNYFENIPNKSMLCVVDTSGSMRGTPLNVAISLGIYAAERAHGDFKNHYISFSSRPQLIKIEGVDFVDKVRRIYKTNLCENTNLTKTFDMLLDIANRPDVAEDDIPSDIVVISDMEIDGDSWMRKENPWTEKSAFTEMEKIRKKWNSYGHKLPRLVYWNVAARNNTILDSGPNISFVSGFSPTIFKQVITGKSGWDLMLEVLMSDRYKNIK